jgi:hypothetical protein
MVMGWDAQMTKGYEYTYQFENDKSKIVKLDGDDPLITKKQYELVVVQKYHLIRAVVKEAVKQGTTVAPPPATESFEDATTPTPTPTSTPTPTNTIFIIIILIGAGALVYLLSIMGQINMDDNTSLVVMFILGVITSIIANHIYHKYSGV